MKLSDMKRVLAEHGIQLTRSLGQNFLHDANQLRRILAQAQLDPSDRVLEIGPGLGSLTLLLAAEAGEILAIEKDRRLVDRLASILQDPASARAKITLLHDDALQFLRREPRDWSAWKVVSNLPYSVASPLLVELALAPGGPNRIVATVQLEVARRVMARPASPDYGLLTLLVQLNYQPMCLFKIPPGSFFPEPAVDSACLTLQRRPLEPLSPALQPLFVRIVKRSFSQRRKRLAKLLKQDWPPALLEQALEKARLSPDLRAEQVSLEKFIEITRTLAHP